MTWDCSRCGQEDGSVMYRGGLCGLCVTSTELAELKVVYGALKLSLEKAITHGTDEEIQKWTALHKGDRLQAEVDRLTKSVLQGNSNMERMERDLYLKVNDVELKLESANNVVKTLQAELALKCGRPFPILHAGFSVPWWLIAPFEPQARHNHDQSLEHLASRGGLDPCEMLHVIHGLSMRGGTSPWPNPTETLKAWVKTQSAFASQELITAQMEELRIGRLALQAAVQERDHVCGALTRATEEMQRVFARAAESEEEMQRVFARAAESESRVPRLCSIHQFANVECRMCSPAVQELERVRETVAEVRKALDVSRFQGDPLVRAMLTKLETLNDPRG